MSKKNPTIQFIVENISCNRGEIGCSDRFAVITSTVTGKQLMIVRTSGAEAASAIVERAIEYRGYPDIYESTSNLSYKDFMTELRASMSLELVLSESEVTPDIIRALKEDF